MGYRGTLPKLGLSPYAPQKLAGCLIEPPPSEPCAKGPNPETTDDAAPPLDPAVVTSKFHGLRLWPNIKLSVTPFHPRSGRGARQWNV